MLRLMLLRHAKAEPHRAGGDHERALAPRGASDSAALAQALSGEHLAPDRILVSDSRRTRETLAAMAAAWPALGECPADADSALYHADPAQLLARIRAAPAATKTLMLIGHNPGLAELALTLTGYGDRYALARMAQKFPTCALAVLDFDIEDWRALDRRLGRLERFVTPTHFGGDSD